MNRDTSTLPPRAAPAEQATAAPPPPAAAEPAAPSASPPRTGRASPPRRRLPLPTGVDRRRTVWTYTISLVLMHVLACLALVPWLFSWTGLVVMILGVHVFGQGINICYHRLLTHRSFAVPKWLERAFVVLALCCLEDTPTKWITTHRHHHNHSDEEEDPHSPLVSFFWSHFQWLTLHNSSTRSMAAYHRYAKDILADPFYMKLEKNVFLALWIYLGHAALFVAAGLGVGYALGGTWVAAVQMGLSLLVWGVIVRTVVVWHITWSVNSLSHLFGYRNYETPEHSRNNFLVALLTVGEGWHNNHHEDPAAASVQHRWWEIDISYYEIKLLEKLGLATRVIPPKRVRRAERAKRRGEG